MKTHLCGTLLFTVVLACREGKHGDETPSQDTSTDTAAARAPWLAPDDRSDAYNFSVPEMAGLVWVRDTAFRIPGFSVPQVFRAPGGRFGMTATRMDGTKDGRLGTAILWSDDGLAWEDSGSLIEPEDFPYHCGEELRDNTVWREGDTITFVLAGGPATGIMKPLPDPVHLCTASTTDFENFEFDEGPLFSGAFESDVIGVPGLLEFDEEGPHIWYNGDLQNKTKEGPGVRVAKVDTETRTAETVIHDPILDGVRVDPNPVYIEGGGVRLFHTDKTPGRGNASIRAVDLDDALNATEQDHVLFYSDGICEIGKQHEGRCLADPTFLRTDDGRMFLYFGDATYSEDTLDPGIGRAMAVDSDLVDR